MSYTHPNEFVDIREIWKEIKDSEEEEFDSDDELF